LRFNRDGLMLLRTNDSFTDLRFLLPYFERVEDPRANCFVMNVLVIPPESGSSDGAAAADEERHAAGLHRDNTVAIDALRNYVAHTVSVYYLQVPERMVGGRLELFRRVPNGQHSPPDATVHPWEGELVVFRGDAYHRVTAVRLRGSKDGTDAIAVQDETTLLRISLVLEQYRIPADKYAATTRLEVNRQQGEMDDFRHYVKIRAGFHFFESFSRMVVIVICAAAIVRPFARSFFGF